MGVDPNQLNTKAVYASYSDAQLIEQTAKEDIVAYEALYDRYAAQVYGVIVQIVRDSAVADELLQETFWQIWQSAQRYSEQNTARAWIFRIARNRSIDELRKQKARPQLEQGVEPADAAISVGLTDDSAADRAEQNLDQEKVQRTIANLPEAQQACLLLAYFEGLTHSSIAARLDLPVGTVKSRMRIGLEKMEHLLRAEGYP